MSTSSGHPPGCPKLANSARGDPWRAPETPSDRRAIGARRTAARRAKGNPRREGRPRGCRRWNIGASGSLLGSGSARRTMPAWRRKRHTRIGSRARRSTSATAQRTCSSASTSTTRPRKKSVGAITRTGGLSFARGTSPRETSCGSRGCGRRGRVHGPVRQQLKRIL